MVPCIQVLSRICSPVNKREVIVDLLQIKPPLHIKGLMADAADPDSVAPRHAPRLQPYKAVPGMFLGGPWEIVGGH